MARGDKCTYIWNTSKRKNKDRFGLFVTTLEGEVCVCVCGSWRREKKEGSCACV